MMRIGVKSVLLVVVSTANVLAQAPTPGGPTFEVVSIKRNLTGEVGARWVDRPDRGFTATNIPVSLVISRAYPGMAPADMIGLPRWATTERYDVAATASLPGATLADRNEMLRAMLAERFALRVHIVTREREAYDLVLARGDGKVGSGIEPTSSSCGSSGGDRSGDRSTAGAGSRSGQPPRLDEPPLPCTLRVVAAVRRVDGQAQLGDLLEGDAPIDTLATTLRPMVGRHVVNKTGLSASYRVRMNFDMTAVTGAPVLPGIKPNDAPSVFTAVQEQLGLKLQSSQAALDTLVIDRLERPVDN